MAKPDQPLRIWITRAQPAATASAARVNAIGAIAVVAPVLTVRPIGGGLDLDDIAALAFTSGHAVAAFAGLSAWREGPAFCVGAATAARAAEAGFADVRSAGGDVAALADLIAASAPSGMVLHPCALEPAADLAALLKARGVGGRAVAVYETTDAGLSAVPAQIDAAMIHSPKAARIVGALVDEVTAGRLTVFAISEAAAAPLRERPFRRLVVAAEPNEAALLKCIRG